jgi:DNA-binding Lrp family transcriptional regulator
MTVQAYILIQAEIGSSERVVLATRAVPGVIESFEVTGPYDVIVRCTAESVDDLGKFIVGAIAKVPGITRTLTCPVVNI